MFGKTEKHYEQHFLLLFKSLGYTSLKDFDERFPGMSADMSLAELNGFCLALKTCYNIASLDTLDLEKHYKFCSVHFKRSLERVARIADKESRPENSKGRLYSLGERLLEKQPREDFERILKTIESDFPDAINWVNWHRQSERRMKLLFPALHNHNVGHLFNNTNGQESLG
ncbi:hypothetical protein BGZ82_004978, partial [Podila clonocystis]